MSRYNERQWPSFALLFALILLLPATLLVFVPIDTRVGIVVAVLLYAAVTAVLVVSSRRITVTDDGLTVGPAHLPRDAIGEVSSFEGEEATAERGVRLDARAWLAIRGGISPVVRIEVLDPADPTPYWLVSTRKPRQLEEALNATRRA
ncbi:DUF3093 domain-containing protein [Salinibacterium sp. dk2585]|uniref:DUF3093 domain-containing protein n=1 Tax=unclassified Salinibacterium TaxID=2632331 RepID=UPI0011C25169|nr:MULTISPECIES: DUF3093 domain-containing protein [unclassified Salinibacterium]QEE61318.1 DUF3093 domain-containing protein [Salinibacterium sp. dk2585]TXK53994.1 DUF3093 domain-containing protein [Salinibacterium sp. dk5596]